MMSPTPVQRMVGTWTWCWITSSIKSKYKPEDILSRHDPSLWRYLPLLPVKEPEGDATPLHAAGGTPVYQMTRLAEKLGLQNLWLKDESRNPTASFKDRASAVVVARAKEIAAEIVVTASTGNAGAALAGMSAAVGQKAIIFAPKSAPQAKVAQLLVFGAKVILVDGTYDDAFDLTIKASNEFGWYCRNTGYNPFTAEGKKTAALEIWEWWQTAHQNWHDEFGEELNHPPLTVFVSVGDGNIISGIHKGFKDVYRLGWMPRVRALLACRRKALLRSRMRSMRTQRRSHPSQLQRSPTRSPWTCRGMGSELSGLRRKRAGRTLTYQTRKFSRPSRNSARLAFLQSRPGRPRMPDWSRPSLSSVVRSEDPILVLDTGSGLKDVRAAMQAVQSAPIIEPTLEAVKRLL